MKHFIKEIIALILQIVLFYALPGFAGPTDMMGLVVLLLFGTLLLSLALGWISDNRFKWLYPLAVALVFLPSILFYYNASALVHALWYLVDGALGLILGSLLRHFSRKNREKKS